MLVSIINANKLKEMDQNRDDERKSREALLSVQYEQGLVLLATLSRGEHYRAQEIWQVAAFGLSENIIYQLGNFIGSSSVPSLKRRHLKLRCPWREQNLGSL